MKRLIPAMFLTLALALPLCAEKVTVYGYGFPSKSAGTDPLRVEHTATAASYTNAKALAALINGCVIKKAKKGFALSSSRRTPPEISSASRAATPVFYETDLTVDAGDRLEKAEAFAFSVEYGSDPELDDAELASEYYSFVAGRITDEICNRILGDAGRNKVKLRALFIDRRLGGRELEVRVRYKR